MNQTERGKLRERYVAQAFSHALGQGGVMKLIESEPSKVNWEAVLVNLPRLLDNMQNGKALQQSLARGAFALLKQCASSALSAKAIAAEKVGNFAPLLQMMWAQEYQIYCTVNPEGKLFGVGCFYAIPQTETAPLFRVRRVGWGTKSDFQQIVVDVIDPTEYEQRFLGLLQILSSITQDEQAVWERIRTFLHEALRQVGTRLEERFNRAAFVAPSASGVLACSPNALLVFDCSQLKTMEVMSGGTASRVQAAAHCSDVSRQETMEQFLEKTSRKSRWSWSKVPIRELFIRELVEQGAHQALLRLRDGKTLLVTSSIHMSPS